MTATAATAATDRRCAGRTKVGRRCQEYVNADWKGSLVTADGTHYCRQHAYQAPVADEAPTPATDTHRMVRPEGPFDMKAKCVRCGLGRGAKVHKVTPVVETPEELAAFEEAEAERHAANAEAFAAEEQAAIIQRAEAIADAQATGTVDVAAANASALAVRAAAAKASEDAARDRAASRRTLGEMQPEERKAVVGKAVRQLQAELTATAPAIAKVLEEPLPGEPAAEERPYRIGARLADATMAATALTFGDTLRAKIADRKATKDGTRLIRITRSEAAALTQVARNLEGTAREGVTAGNLSAVSLVFSCTQAQANLARLFA